MEAKITKSSIFWTAVIVYFVHKVLFSFSEHYAFSIPATLLLILIAGRPVSGGKCGAWIWQRCVEKEVPAHTAETPY